MRSVRSPISALMTFVYVLVSYKHSAVQKNSGLQNTILLIYALMEDEKLAPIKITGKVGQYTSHKYFLWRFRAIAATGVTSDKECEATGLGLSPIT